VSFVEIVLALTVLLDRLKGLIMQQKIGTPLKCPELNLTPEAQGVELSEVMQQALSLLAVFNKNQRIIVKGSPVGALRTTSSRIQDIKHITGTGANDEVQGTDIPCSEVMCMGHPDNTGKVWVRSLVTATVNNAWPLGAGEVVNISVDNYRDLQGLIVVDGEKLICAIA
jgi:hypothetical protein